MIAADFGCGGCDMELAGTAGTGGRRKAASYLYVLASRCFDSLEGREGRGLEGW